MDFGNDDNMRFCAMQIEIDEALKARDAAIARAEQANQERDDAKAQVIAEMRLVAKIARERDAARAEVERWKTRANDLGGEVASMRAMLGEWCSAIDGNCEAPYDDTLALLEADDDG